MGTENDEESLIRNFHNFRIGKTSVLPIFYFCIKNHSSIKIPFTQLSTGHIVVQIEMEGNTLSMIVDTGSSGTLISSVIAQELKLKTESSEEKAMGASSHEIEVSTVDNITLTYQGKFLITEVMIIVMEMEGINTAIQETDDIVIDGILGADILSRTSAVIDYGASELSLIRTLP